MSSMTSGAGPSTVVRGRNNYGFALAILLVVGCVTDVQGVALLPLLPKMVEALGLTASQTSWALNSLSIATAVMVGLSARYADIIGHRRVLLPLLALGVIGSVICALAGSFIVLLVGRVLLGLAVSAPMAWAMLKIRADAEGLNKAALYNGTIISIMTPIGLILGGVLLELGANWAAFFWIVAAGYLILFAMTVMVAETPPKDRVHVPIDWVGSIGLGVWLVLLLLPLSNANTWGWGSVKVIGLLIAGVVVLVAWAMHQRAIANPLMDFKGMDVRQVVAGYSTYCVVAMTASGLYILEPGLAQTPKAAGYGFGSTTFHASLALLPILPAAFIAAAISKPMLAKLGPRPPIAVGGMGCVIAFAGMALFHDSLAIFYVWVFIYGVGIIIAFNVGWALTASAGRQDNMSTTFGIQYAMAIPTAALLTAIILTIEAQNAKPVAALANAALPTEGTYTALFFMLAAISLVGYVLNGLFIVPKRLRHQSAHLEDVVGAEDAAFVGIPAEPAAGRA
jgi:MFS family permease